MAGVRSRRHCRKDRNVLLIDPSARRALRLRTGIRMTCDKFQDGIKLVDRDQSF